MVFMRKIVKKKEKKGKRIKNHYLCSQILMPTDIPMLKIRCKNTNETRSFAEGTSLLEVYKSFSDTLQLPYPVVSAKVNNSPQSLTFRLYQTASFTLSIPCRTDITATSRSAMQKC